MGKSSLEAIVETLKQSAVRSVMLAKMDYYAFGKSAQSRQVLSESGFNLISFFE
jgi:hypothetical protein